MCFINGSLCFTKYLHAKLEFVVEVNNNRYIESSRNLLIR